MHEAENFCQIVGKEIELLRNYCWVVELLCLSGLYGVFFYSIVEDFGVGEPGLAQLLLPCVEEDAVEGGAESHIKNIDAGRGRKLLEKVFHASLYVDVHCLCKGAVGGVV